MAGALPEEINQADLAEPELVPAEILPTGEEAIETAFAHPVDIAPLLPLGEQAALVRVGGYDVTEHILTTVLLQRAGVSRKFPTFRAYGEIVEATQHLEKAIHRRGALEKTVQAVQDEVDEAKQRAAPYLQAYGVVKPFAVAYQTDFDGGRDRDRVMTEIYDPTEDLAHGVLRDLFAYRRQTLGERTIHAERIFRLMWLARQAIASDTATGSR